MAATLSVPSSHLLKRGTIHQALNAISSTNWEGHLGKVVEAATGEKFKYVRTCTTLTGVDHGGYPAFWADSQHTTVTDTQKDAYGHNHAGVFCRRVGATTGNATPGTNYLWIQTAGRVPSAAASCGTGAVLVATTGRFVEATTATCTSYDQNAVGLQLHSGQFADIMLIAK